MFTLFNRRRRRRGPNINNILITNNRGHPGAKRATSLPPVSKTQRHNGLAHSMSNNVSSSMESRSGDFHSRQPSQPRSVNLLYGELPWHVSHSDVYGISTGVQQDFPEVQKMPLFGSVPALHQMNSMHHVDLNNNNNDNLNKNNNNVNVNGKFDDVSSNSRPDSKTKSNENDNEQYVSTLRYFNLRQPVNIAGPIDPKVILHDSRPDEEGRLNQNKGAESPMVIQPLSLLPDWR